MFCGDRHKCSPRAHELFLKKTRRFSNLFPVYTALATALLSEEVMEHFPYLE